MKMIMKVTSLRGKALRSMLRTSQSIRCETSNQGKVERGDHLDIKDRKLLIYLSKTKIDLTIQKQEM